MGRGKGGRIRLFSLVIVNSILSLCGSWTIKNQTPTQWSVLTINLARSVLQQSLPQVGMVEPLRVWNPDPVKDKTILNSISPVLTYIKEHPLKICWKVNTSFHLFSAQKIHVSQDTTNMLTHMSEFTLEFRGFVSVKVRFCSAFTSQWPSSSTFITNRRW